MVATYRRAMDALYLLCVSLAGVALVLISAIVPWGVFTRYVLNSASSWPEAMAILLSIVLTFFGAAASYRLGLHMRVSFVRDHMPAPMARVADFLAECLMLAVGLFMTFNGISLCQPPGTSRSPSSPRCPSVSPTCRSRSAGSASSCS